MKKLLLVLTVGLLAAFSANAQFYVGGSLSIQPGAATDKDGNDALGLEIAPEVGYILNDKMAIGATLSYDNTLFGGGSLFSIAPYLRYKKIIKNGVVKGLYTKHIPRAEKLVLFLVVNYKREHSAQFFNKVLPPLLVQTGMIQIRT